MIEKPSGLVAYQLVITGLYTELNDKLESICVASLLSAVRRQHRVLGTDFRQVAPDLNSNPHQFAG